jgi:hypothetical protein
MDKQLAQHRTQEQGSRIAVAAHLNYEFAMHTQTIRMQVRSEKSCVTWGGSPPGLEAKPLEFRTKVMNGKV